MLIDSQVTTLLEGMRKLQAIVQGTSGVSSSDKIKSQQILTECEEALYTSFGINKGLTYERVKLDNTTMTSQELTNKVTTLAFDSQNFFAVLNTMPATRGKKVDFIRRRDDNHLVLNKFTSKRGHIRAEFGNEQELWFIIQYEDGSYNIATEITVELIG